MLAIVSPSFFYSPLCRPAPGDQFQAKGWAQPVEGAGGQAGLTVEKPAQGCLGNARLFRNLVSAHAAIDDDSSQLVGQVSWFLRVHRFDSTCYLHTVKW